MNSNLKIVLGFLILFGLYHAAEYFVLFEYNPTAFLGVQIIFFIAAWQIARWQKFKGLGAQGLDTKQLLLKHLATGMLMGALLYGVTFVTSLNIGSETIENTPTTSEMVTPLALFCFGVFFSSFSEDILTRGYLFGHFGDRVPKEIFVFLSATIYLLNHIYRLNDGWETCTYLFSLGVLFAIPLVLTKRLWFTGGMHWIGNTTYYFTHSIISTKTNNNHLAPNIIFMLTIVVFIPITIFVARRIRGADSGSTITS